MRKALIALAATLPLLVASPASAASVRVDAADHVTRTGTRGASACAVRITYVHDVRSFCWSDGVAWFKVRVPGVEGDVTRVQAAETGDCSGQRITWVQRSDVIVKITNSGEFDCHYTSVVVRYT